MPTHSMHAVDDEDIFASQHSHPMRARRNSPLNRRGMGTCSPAARNSHSRGASPQASSPTALTSQFSRSIDEAEALEIAGV